MKWSMVAVRLLFYLLIPAMVLLAPVGTWTNPLFVPAILGGQMILAVVLRNLRRRPKSPPPEYDSPDAIQPR